MCPKNSSYCDNSKKKNNRGRGSGGGGRVECVRRIEVIVKMQKRRVGESGWM